MQENSIKHIEEDEIDLRELFKTLMKRKKFIIAFTALVTFGAIVLALMKTPIYEARALIEIGNYKLHNDNNYNNSNNNSNKAVLDNASQLVRKLNILYIDMSKGKKDKTAEVESIKVPKSSKEFIEIKASSTSNKLAVEKIQEIVEFIQNKHQKILDDVKQRREIEIANIDSQISNIKNRAIPLLENKIKIQNETLKGFKKQIEAISTNLKKIEVSDSSLAALKLMEKRDVTSFVIKLNTQLMDLKDKKDTMSTTTVNKLEEKKLLVSSLMLPHNYKNTQIVGEVITNDYPVKPKKKSIVIVAFVTSLVLSIFMVFFLEFIRREDKNI